MKRSALGWIGIVAAVAIIVAAVLVRRVGPADPVADVGQQRAAVTRFNQLVERADWPGVYRAMTEPGLPLATFVNTMTSQSSAQRITDVKIERLHLLRAPTSPLLQADETVTTGSGTDHMTAFFIRRNTTWLFAFSAPSGA